MSGPLTTPAYAPAERRSGGAWRAFAKAALSVGLLALLFRQVDVGQIAHQFATASVGWIGVALCLYLVTVVASAWRWRQLLVAQHIAVSNLELVRSYLVATFFNNFLPSNIGGDVVRIRDTVAAAGSRTLAATVVLLDRGIGLLGLLLVAAAGAAVAHVGAAGQLPFGPSSLFLISGVGLAALAMMVQAPDLVGRLLAPLKRLHAEWVEVRLQRLVAMFARFRARPSSLVYCLGGAVVVQVLLVAFYAAVAASVRIPISAAHLAVLIPLSFVVQMAPVSMNGFGVREATFSAYFRMLGLPIESALVLSLLGTASIMLFSLSGAALYAARR